MQNTFIVCTGKKIWAEIMCEYRRNMSFSL